MKSEALLYKQWLDSGLCEIMPFQHYKYAIRENEKLMKEKKKNDRKN